MGFFLPTETAVIQPGYLAAPVSINAGWNPCWLWLAGFGADASNMRNLVNTRQVAPTGDTNNTFYPYGTEHGLAVRNTAGTSESALNYTASTSVLSGCTELTMVVWLQFKSGGTSAQWLNFRTELQHTLDVFSQTSSSITWGSDWAGAWNGANQQTLSGLNDGDFVCIGASITQSGARFFAQGKLSGTKSGSGFTTSSSSVAIVSGMRLPMFGGVAFRRALSDAEMSALTLNPVKELFNDWYSQLLFVSSASGVTGTMAATNGDDTSSASGTTTVKGTSAASNANDTMAASGAPTDSGTSAATSENDTMSASGTTTVVGTMVATNAGDSMSASGAPGSAVAGTMTATNQDDSMSAAGTTTVRGMMAAQAGNDTMGASGTPSVNGTMAAQNQNDTMSASGTAGPVIPGGTRLRPMVGFGQ